MNIDIINNIITDLKSKKSEHYMLTDDLIIYLVKNTNLIVMRSNYDLDNTKDTTRVVVSR